VAEGKWIGIKVAVGVAGLVTPIGVAAWGTDGVVKGKLHASDKKTSKINTRPIFIDALSWLKYQVKCKECLREVHIAEPIPQ